MVCAGMWGRLMERLLRQDMEQVRGMRELILQPQSELEIFRHFLRKTGFVADREDMVEEGGKYYPAMRVSWGGGQKAESSIPPELCDRFGEGLLGGRHPVLRQYLERQRGALSQLREKLSQENTLRARIRLEDIREELQAVEQALGYYK